MEKLATNPSLPGSDPNQRAGSEIGPSCLFRDCAVVGEAVTIMAAIVSGFGRFEGMIPWRKVTTFQMLNRDLIDLPPIAA